MLVSNKSHRVSIYSKAFNFAMSPHSFSYQSSRRLGLQQRLYFEYLYTLKVNGQAFFYTLTYNDKSIPTYRLGDDVINCFDYSHIRTVTVGSLEKTLKRKYGSKLRYFCACETGEGKGIRGLGCNPHYHFIFFIQPWNDDYKKISPCEFRSLVRKVWQGAEHVKYQDAKFGIAKEGDLLGLVINQSALKYVSKYVLKDAKELDWDARVWSYYQNYYKSKGFTNEAFYWFYLYNKQLQDLDPSDTSLHGLYRWLGLDQYNKWRHFTNDPISDRSYIRWLRRYCTDLDVKSAFTTFNTWFNDRYLDMRALLDYRDFQNKYSGKPRYSKSLGEYGLNFVIDSDYTPSFSIPTADGYDLQPITMFYYRKLYYDVYKCDVTGNVLYRLNDKGVNQHLNTLHQRLVQLKTRTAENISIVTNELLPQFQLLRSKCKKYNFSDDLLYKYSCYKLVYEFRNYTSRDFVLLDDDFSFQCVKSDYSFFVRNDAYYFDWDLRTVYFKTKFAKDVQPFHEHQSIKLLLSIFKFLDLINDTVNEFRSDACKQKFVQHAEQTKRIKASLQ